MSTHFVKKELRKIEYNSPIDVAVLFNSENISYTLNHVFGSFLDRFTESEEQKMDYTAHMFFFEKSNTVNVEYTFLVDKLAELVDETLQFAIDFKLELKESLNKQEFLIVSLLEELLGLVRMNSRKIMTGGKPYVNYSPSYFRSVVLEYGSFNDEVRRYIQMNAVSFSGFALKKYLDENLYYLLMESFPDSKVKQVPGVFGSRQCGVFWKTENKLSKHFAES